MRAWFLAAAEQVIRWTPARGVAIFYQSDVRHQGAWVDKGYLVLRAAEEARADVAWHKIVCRSPPGTVSLGRPTYSHMICVGRAPGNVGPDVLPTAGAMTWSRAIGVTAAALACDFVRQRTSTRVIVDPFCGRGTVLAVANAQGFNAIGVDLSEKRCRAARRLVIAEDSPRTLEGALARGACLFNAGAFWDAHEVWEHRWRIEEQPERRLLLQGLIQVAAGFHKLVAQRSPESAHRLLTKGLVKLDATLSLVDLGAFPLELGAYVRALGSGGHEELHVPRLSPALAGSTSMGAR